MKFTKYHALGNDYIVVNPKDLEGEITPREVMALCNRHYGMGSDGILYGPQESKSCDFALRIFNPDAGEAEKSGNGLRIFSRYLWDLGLVRNVQFSIETKGGNVIASVYGDGAMVSVEMGRVGFTHDYGKFPTLKGETIVVKGHSFEFYRANVGNPHCVILVRNLSPHLANNYGKAIEEDNRFTSRTNAQFMQVIDRGTVQIEIWERGAGYTLASGSSSTASVAVAYALGLCDSKVSVKMPGGTIEIIINEGFCALMNGPVCKIGEGDLADEALSIF